MIIMYARQVYARYKPENFDLFNKRFDNDVLPLLKKQSGFRDELSFIDKGKKEAFTMSFWDTKQDAEKYARDVYPSIHKKMEDLFEDTPKVRSFDVTNSTWYDIHA